MTAAWTRAARSLGLASALLVVLATGACAGPSGKGSVTVLVPWGSAEKAAFETVVAAFERESGISVTIETTRALSQELGADLLAGDPPDIAALPSAGAIGQYAQNRKLQPLDTVVSTTDYGPPWSDLMQPGGTGTRIYAVPVKVDVKSLIWFDPAMFHRLGLAVPTTLAQLNSIDKTIRAAGGSPWCLAVASPPTSGWPGADWIADIMLSRYGPTAYQEWVQGNPVTRGDVAQAWQTWGQLIGTDGNAVDTEADDALSTLVNSVHPKPGGCYMQHGTLVDEGFPPGLKFQTDYDYFPFPPAGGSGAAGAAGAIQVSGDFIGVFTTNPLADQLVSYLTKPDVQEKFVTDTGVDGFSANSQVPLSAYQREGPALEGIARLLGQRELCFGAGDAMPPELSADFDQAILEYLAAPKTLVSGILPELEAATPPATDALRVCGRPASTPGRSS
jgi:alpha-glucoside transport system substrate-binding protein